MFRNIAHRGDSIRAPENTLASFEAAVDAGVSAIEMDLRATADGHVVVMHDSTVDRTTDGRGAVGDLVLEEVRSLDAGAWFDSRFAGERVPELPNVLDRLVDRASLVLHVKDAGRGIEQAVARELASRGVADRVRVSSNHHSVLTTTRELVAEIGTTWIVWFRDWRWWMWYVAGKVRRLKADCVAPPGGCVTETMLKYFHDRGVTVRAWGVGRDEDLAARLITLGVDGMTFDDPRRLSELLAVAREDIA